MEFARPVAFFDPAKSVLCNDHYHVSYVTNDIERADTIFRTRFGVTTFRETQSETPAGASISQRAVWLGNMMYEIICGQGPGMELYSNHAPEGGDFVLAFHHYGYCLSDDASWSALRRRIEADKWDIVLDSDNPGFCRAIYVDVPELGHYLEFVQPMAGLIERLNATPVA